MAGPLHVCKCNHHKAIHGFLFLVWLDECLPAPSVGCSIFSLLSEFNTQERASGTEEPPSSASSGAGKKKWATKTREGPLRGHAKNSVVNPRGIRASGPSVVLGTTDFSSGGPLRSGKRILAAARKGMARVLSSPARRCLSSPRLAQQALRGFLSFLPRYQAEGNRKSGSSCRRRDSNDQERNRWEGSKASGLPPLQCAPFFWSLGPFPECVCSEFGQVTEIQTLCRSGDRTRDLSNSSQNPRSLSSLWGLQLLWHGFCSSFRAACGAHSTLLPPHGSGALLRRQIKSFCPTAGFHLCDLRKMFRKSHYLGDWAPGAFVGKYNNSCLEFHVANNG